jgi:hypothetical protein
METIHLELDADEAGILIYALGRCYTLPEAWPLAQRVMKLVSHPNLLPTGAASVPPPAVGGSTPAAVAAPESRPLPQVARTNARTDTPAGELAITPIEVEQSADGKAMVVTYLIRSGSVAKKKTVRSWDPTLFSSLLATKGVATTFVVKESKGFLNIVGVKR